VCFVTQSPSNSHLAAIALYVGGLALLLLLVVVVVL
jgi:hypothetical protein